MNVESWAEDVLRKAGLALMGMRRAEKLEYPFLPEDFKLYDVHAPCIEWLHDYGYVKVFSERDISYILLTEAGLEAIATIIYGDRPNTFVQDKTSATIAKEIEASNAAIADTHEMWGRF